MKKKSPSLLFSKSEMKILEIVDRRRLKIVDITKEFYKGKPPVGTNNNIAMLIRRINHKCELYDLDWKLLGEGAGRSGRTIWRGYV